MSQPISSRKRFGLTCMTALAVFAFASISLTSTAGAARSAVSGTIALHSDPSTLSSPSGVSYGDTVRFDTSVSGRMAAKGYLANSVVCLQDGHIVYLSSTVDLSAGFELVDGLGNGLEWDGGPASCLGTLVYLIDGRNPTIEYLDQTVFEVN